MPRFKGETEALCNPPTSLTVPDFSAWKEAWDHGLTVDASLLIGEWRAIAIATTSKCSSITANAYNPNGLNNADRSKLFLLMFEQDTRSSEFFIQILNVGRLNADQGPYQVNLACASEPYGLTYAFRKQ